MVNLIGKVGDETVLDMVLRSEVMYDIGKANIPEHKRIFAPCLSDRAFQITVVSDGDMRHVLLADLNEYEIYSDDIPSDELLFDYYTEDGSNEVLTFKTLAYETTEIVFVLYM